MGIANNNGHIACFLDNALGGSGNVLGGSSGGGFSGGVGRLHLSLRTGINIGLASAAGTGIELGTRMLSCSNSTTKASTVCRNVFRTPPIVFTPMLPTRGNRSCVLFNGHGNNPVTNECHGPCTRVIEKCSRGGRSAVVTDLSLRRSLGFVIPKLGTGNLMSFGG